MQETATRNGAPSIPAVPANGQPILAGVAPLFAPERLQEAVAALEEPFDPTEIKWRVTNTSQIGSRNGAQMCGQMLAYADPRAYTDRLNELFTPAGWTRDYSIQMVQNFERKERGATERSITAKIVVTCKVTIHGLGAHTGLGEEWADNDNAGTAAEAQAFKRACSCSGLGRYLYDLGGQWVDLDDHKRPLQTPNLPDWARSKRQQRTAQSGQRPGTGQAKAGGNRASDNGRGGLYRSEVLGQVKSLCGAVGFSLSRSVLRAVANLEDPDKRYSALCRELNLASESVDDIPDRTVLRQLVETLEAEASQQTGTSKVSPTSGAQSGREKDLSELRGRLLQEATRVSGETKRTLAEVINQAAKGAFSLATLKTLGVADVGKVQAALTELEQIARPG